MSDAAAPPDTGKWLAAEALGAGLLAFVILAASILGERFADGNTALVVLMTSLAGASAYAVIAQLFSGRNRDTLAMGIAAAGFNPAIALAHVLAGRLALVPALLAAAAQIAGGLLGAMVAHLVTNMGVVQVATQMQTGIGVWTGEFIATALFVLVVLRGHGRTALAAAGLLAVALATPSLSFANPAVTFARTLTDSFSSIRLQDGAIIAAFQLLGAIAAYALNGVLGGGQREA